MRFSTRFISVYCAACIGTLLSLTNSGAVAENIMLQASICAPRNEYVGYTTSGENGIVNDEEAHNNYYCAIPSDNATGAGDDEGDNWDHKRGWPEDYAVLVYVEDLNNDPANWVLAACCITFTGSSGGSCGSSDLSTGSPTVEALSPPTTVWEQASTSASDYPVVFIQLPDADDIGQSRILGITAVSL